jgi:hypothetical protein
MTPPTNRVHQVDVVEDLVYATPAGLPLMADLYLPAALPPLHPSLSGYMAAAGVSVTSGWVRI